MAMNRREGLAPRSIMMVEAVVPERKTWMTRRKA
jgi:hypothetical protein